MHRCPYSLYRQLLSGLQRFSTQIFFQTQTLSINFLCRLFSHIPEMPGLMRNAGYIRLILGITQNKAVLIAVLAQPLINLLVCGAFIHCIYVSDIPISCSLVPGIAPGLCKLLCLLGRIALLHTSSLLRHRAFAVLLLSCRQTTGYTPSALISSNIF